MRMLKFKLIIIFIILAGTLANAGYVLAEYYKVWQFNNTRQNLTYKLEQIREKKEFDKALLDLEEQITQEKEKREKAEVQNKQAEERSKKQIDALQKELEASQEPDLVAIISQWQSVIAYISCNFYYDTGVKYASQSGSGVLKKDDDSNKIQIFTNKHVAVYNEQYAPKTCSVKFPDYEEFIIDNSSIDLVSISAGGYDWAVIDMKNAPSNIKDFAYAFDICKEIPAIGDEIVILGYPVIGSQTNITATEGIISGYDGDYYITSAKIEKGNSGGTAILLKNSCYLGIPTFAKVGQIESLSRILKADKIFDF